MKFTTTTKGDENEKMAIVCPVGVECVEFLFSCFNFIFIHHLLILSTIPQ